MEDRSIISRPPIPLHGFVLSRRLCSPGQGGGDLESMPGTLCVSQKCWTDAWYQRFQSTCWYVLGKKNKEPQGNPDRLWRAVI